MNVTEVRTSIFPLDDKFSSVYEEDFPEDENGGMKTCK